MYVKIIDSGECFSTTMEFIDGVYANKTEWARHNFYPQNGMVGEVKKITPMAYIVKIADGIYVPMSEHGIREISYDEYLAGKNNNICTGMNDRQRRINEGMDMLTGFTRQHLPDMRPHFQQDIITNIQKLTCDYEVNIFLPDLEKSCVIYAADMILEYKDQLGSTLPLYVISEISEQVIDVYKNLFKTDFKEASSMRCKVQIKEFVGRIDARNQIDNYYYQVNQRYSWH